MNTKKQVRKDEVEYGYYSKLLQKPFDSLEELRSAEVELRTKQLAKEAAAAAKKADAQKVEVAFKALNQSRRDYKENLVKLANVYQEDLTRLKASFEADRDRVKAALADAETNYQKALREFTEKYPEGYHITLKDGDFETTISSNTVKNAVSTANDAVSLREMLETLFRL